MTGLNRDYYEPAKPAHSHAAAAGVAGAAGGLAVGAGAVLAYDALTDSPTGHHHSATPHTTIPHSTINRDIDINTTVYNERPGYVAGPDWAPSYHGGGVDVIETREVDVVNYQNVDEVEYVEETDVIVERDAFGNVVEYETIEETVRTILEFSFACRTLDPNRKTCFWPFFDFYFFTIEIPSLPRFDYTSFQTYMVILVISQPFLGSPTSLQLS